jgi:hypothetical protein
MVFLNEHVLISFPLSLGLPCGIFPSRFAIELWKACYMSYYNEKLVLNATK